MKTFKKILLFIAIVAILGTAGGFWVAFKMMQGYSVSEPGWQTSMRVMVDPRSVFPDKDDLYVLVLGTDFNYTDKDIMFTKNTRSDTMMLFHLDLKNKTVKQLSIPRDTYAFIPGDCYKGDCHDKINAAFAVGGPVLSRRVVASMTGISSDYYVRIKEQGLKDLVNAVGGIDVDVDENMNYDDSWGHLHIHLKKGFQHLDGDQAAGFARFRHDEIGDYGRMERQQKVIRAIAGKLESPIILTKLNSVVHVARENVETDLTYPQLLALANLYKDTKMSDLKTYTLPTVPQDINEGGTWVSYVVVQDDQAKQVISEFETDEPPVQQVSAITVEVLNGSGLPGVAQEVAGKLRAGGFLVSRVGNADSFDYDKTQIVDHTGKGEGIAVAKLLSGGNLETMSKPENPRKVDVTVIVGKDQQLSEDGTQ